MKFTERGLATIRKGLDLMANQPMPIQEQQRLQGLPEYQLATAMAATTYTSLPDMFNHFERGYELYLTLLDEPSSINNRSRQRLGFTFTPLKQRCVQRTWSKRRNGWRKWKVSIALT